MANPRHDLKMRRLYSGDSGDENESIGQDDPAAMAADEQSAQDVNDETISIRPRAKAPPRPIRVGQRYLSEQTYVSPDWAAEVIGVPLWWVADALPTLRTIEQRKPARGVRSPLRQAIIPAWRLATTGIKAPIERDVLHTPGIYFIEVVPDGPIKIGSAADPKRRLSTFQVANPSELRLMMTLPLEAGLEEDLHRRFASARIRGEWFRRDKALMGFVIDHYEAIIDGSKYPRASVCGDSDGIDLREAASQLGEIIRIAGIL